MMKEDFRSVTTESRGLIRKRAIKLIENGSKKKDVAKIFGVKQGTM